jgi:large conductance mechanosensitive channel
MAQQLLQEATPANNTTTMLRNNLNEFILFIREKGVLGLAIGIIVGGAVTKFVNAIVNDIVNPLIGVVTGRGGDLSMLAYTVPFTKIIFKWGDLLSNLIEFIAILFIVYFIFMKLPIMRDIDKKKEE